MDQLKIGKFLAALRKEKQMTQEQLAEQLSVARRTVSRWETGINLPDVDILMELSDFYDVELREILDGERRLQDMDSKTEDTILKVVEYENELKKRNSKFVIIFSLVGVVSLIVFSIMSEMELSDTFLPGFLKGFTISLTFLALLCSIAHASGTLAKVYKFKKRLFDRRKKGTEA